MIDLEPAVIGSSVGIQLDGRRIATMAKPDLRVPWRESRIVVDGNADVVIGLTEQPLAMGTDVFLAGRSVADGRDLAVVRAAAPMPLSEHEVWLLGTPHLRISPTEPFVPPGLPSWLVLASTLIWIGAVVASPFPPSIRVGVGILMLISSVFLIIMLLRVWGIVAIRTYHRTLQRKGERAARWAYVGVFLVVPVVLFAGLGLIALFSNR